MSNSKTIYKKISMVDAKDRTLNPLNPTTKNQVNTIVSNFIQYLKNKHS